jgi:hypothetical protein
MTRTLEDLLTEAGLSTTYKHSSGTLVIPLAQYARFAALVRADALEQAARMCDGVVKSSFALTGPKGPT